MLIGEADIFMFYYVQEMAPPKKKSPKAVVADSFETINRN